MSNCRLHHISRKHGTLSRPVLLKNIGDTARGTPLAQDVSVQTAQISRIQRYDASTFMPSNMNAVRIMAEVGRNPEYEMHPAE